MPKAPKTISGHLKDLGKRDVAIVQETANWLESQTPTPREISRRVVSKRNFFRLVAAQMLLKAAQGDVGAAREIMDRTEGKVADVVITGNMSDMVKALEAGRQRLIAARKPQDVVVDGEIVSPQEALPVQVPTDQPDPKN